MSVVAEVGVQLNTRRAVNNLRQLESATQKSSKAFNAMGLALKAIPFIGLADATRRFFKGFAEADKARAAVRSLGVDAGVLEQKLLKVSNSLGGLVGQTELTTAAYDVASAGFTDAGQAAEILEASAKGAVGGLSDLNTVADATTSVLNAYGLSSDKAGKLVDGFIQTQNDGKIVVAQYAAQIGRVAPIAAAAGVGIEELNAAISSVTATGVPVESTFAGLRQAIASVIKPTDEAKKTSAALGIEFTSAAIKAKGFGGFLQEVVDKTGGSEVALTKLFGSVEAVATILPLANDNLDSFNQNLENQADAAGAADKATELLGGTVSAQATSIVNNIGNIARQLDTVLGPALKRILKGLNDIISAASKAISKLGDLTTGELERASARFQGFNRVLIGSEGGLKDIKNAVEELNPAISGSNEQLDRMQGALNRASNAAKLVGPNAASEMTKLAEETQGAILVVEKLIAKRREALGAVGAQPVGGKSVVNPEIKRIEELLAAQDSRTPKSTGLGKTELTAAEKQLEASKKLSESLKNQTILATALTNQEKNSLKLRIDKLAIDKEFPALSEKQRQTLKDQLEALFSQKNVTASLIEQADARKTKEEEIAAAQEAAAQKLQQIYDQIGSTIASGVVDTLSAAVDQTKSLADAAANTLRNVANILLQLGVNTALQSTGLGIFKNLAGFANGGRPPVGKPSIVGERGPELFVPNTSGTIVPNNKLGGGGATNVVVNVDAKGSSASGDSGAGKQLGGLIGAAVQAELIKQQRPGGLLSR